jgi:hypothetical protein
VALVGVALRSRFFGRDSRVIPDGPEQESRPEVDSLGVIVGDSRWPWQGDFPWKSILQARQCLARSIKGRFSGMAVRDRFQEWQCLGRSAAGRLFGHGSAYDTAVRDGFQAWQCLERSGEGRLFGRGSA